MSDIDWVITDSGISPKMLEAIEEQGVKVTIVPLPEA